MRFDSIMAMYDMAIASTVRAIIVAVFVDGGEASAREVMLRWRGRKAPGSDNLFYSY
jgi:dsRNA-specific ribonuclease